MCGGDLAHAAVIPGRAAAGWFEGEEHFPKQKCGRMSEGGRLDCCWARRICEWRGNELGAGRGLWSFQVGRWLSFDWFHGLFSKNEMVDGTWKPGSEAVHPTLGCRELPISVICDSGHHGGSSTANSRTLPSAYNSQLQEISSLYGN